MSNFTSPGVKAILTAQLNVINSMNTSIETKKSGNILSLSNISLDDLMNFPWIIVNSLINSVLTFYNISISANNSDEYTTIHELKDLFIDQINIEIKNNLGQKNIIFPFSKNKFRENILVKIKNIISKHYNEIKIVDDLEIKIKFILIGANIIDNNNWFTVKAIKYPYCENNDEIIISS